MYKITKKTTEGILDIGANKGLYTQELLKKNSSLECHLLNRQN